MTVLALAANLDSTAGEVTYLDSVDHSEAEKHAEQGLMDPPKQTKSHHIDNSDITSVCSGSPALLS